MLWLKCKHPANKLGVRKKETREQHDEDFDIVTYHLICHGCGEAFELQYSTTRNDIDAFMARDSRVWRRGQEMNKRQQAVLRLLDADLRRDLYEGGDGGKEGCGRYWVTYSAEEKYVPLTRDDIAELLKSGAILRKWKDCDGWFILTTPNVDFSERASDKLRGRSNGLVLRQYLEETMIDDLPEGQTQHDKDDAVPLDCRVRALLPCPFCGGEPEMLHKGNKFTAKRSVTIKCKQCRVQRTDAAMRFGMDWLEGVAVDHWNKRPNAEVRRSPTTEE